MRNKNNERNNIFPNFMKDVVKWSFLFLMVAQIILGMIWIVGNFSQEALFHDTKLYLEAVTKKQIDEYMGPLYPVLIWISKGIESITGFPYYGLLYLLQIACSVYAVDRILRDIAKGKMRILLGLYTFTFPLLTQMHLAVIPYSLVFSLTILLVSECIAFLKNKGKMVKGSCLKICLLWVTATLLLPEYGLFSGIMIAICFAGVFKCNKSEVWKLLAAFLISVMCMGSVTVAVPTPTCMGRAERSMGTVVLHRFVWPDFMSNQFFWDEGVNSVFTNRELLEASQFPERIDYEFMPKMQGIYGVKEADEICFQMAVSNVLVNTKQVITAIGKDFLWNVNPILGNQIVLLENERSLNIWNYSRLQDQTPQLAKYYVRISTIGWNVMCLLSAVIWLYKYLKKKRNEKEHTVPYVRLMFGAGMLCMVLYYTFTTGMQDYKKMMPITFLWQLFVVKGCTALWRDGD